MDYLQEALDNASNYLRGNVMKRPMYRNNSPTNGRKYIKKQLQIYADVYNMSAHQFKNRLVKWSKDVKRRDNKECIWCNKTYGLVAHHIWHKVWCPESALDVDNGITLCHDCHMEQHKLDK